MSEKILNLPTNFDTKRDAYGFTVRPQHIQRFREYANIYKEEEEERSEKWKIFLEQQVESAESQLSEKDHSKAVHGEATEQKAESVLEKSGEGDEPSGWTSVYDGLTGDCPRSAQVTEDAKPCKVKTWFEIRPSLRVVENMMSFRTKKRKSMKDVPESKKHLPSIEEVRLMGEESEEETGEEEHFDEILNASGNASTEASATSDRVSEALCAGMNASTEASPNSDRVSKILDAGANASTEASATSDGVSEILDAGVNSSTEASPTCDRVSQELGTFSWKEELEFLVRGGLPRALRGEVWQAFVGVNTRRVERYYQDLLASENNKDNGKECVHSVSGSGNSKTNANSVGVPEKWRKQIEKDLPRTFPGHPALDEDGRNSLRRLLLAYARHNPSVGYCQAMNFFAGLLLLMMPEENAFWTLVGILDDYFDGYYSEEMIESQLDQLVFEELMRERFPKLVHHLDYLGVQVAWISGPWFLSIFVNMLPWETVLRVWDVLLFEGNRVMLFRTALALMDLYGPALVTTKDAGDAVTLLQSLAGSTFDSSQLVLTACMGFLAVTETRLQELRDKHRPAVLEASGERLKGRGVWKDSKGLASKLYSFKHDREPLIIETNKKEGSAPFGNELTDRDISHLGSKSNNLDDFLSGLTVSPDVESLPDLQEQVVWMKVELCRLLEEKRLSTLRAEELETAFMEMIKQDNRRQLSARVEQLEHEVTELRQFLADKREQENAMLQVLMRVEQEQRVTEDARLSAEQDAAAQRYAVHVLEEKYEKAMVLVAQMEKRVVIAESMLEATLQYESGQVKAQSTVGTNLNQNSTQSQPTRRIGLLSRPFALGWRDWNKGKASNVDQPNETTSIDEGKPPNVEKPSDSKSINEGTDSTASSGRVSLTYKSPTDNAKSIEDDY